MTKILIFKIVLHLEFDILNLFEICHLIFDISQNTTYFEWCAWEVSNLRPRHYPACSALERANWWA